jgi:hypothetical protein
MEKIKMSRCPEKCRTCHQEEKKEKKAEKERKWKKEQCRRGDMPEMEDVPGLSLDSDWDGEILIVFWEPCNTSFLT